MKALFLKVVILVCDMPELDVLLVDLLFPKDEVVLHADSFFLPKVKSVFHKVIRLTVPYDIYSAIQGKNVLKVSSHR